MLVKVTFYTIAVSGKFILQLEILTFIALLHVTLIYEFYDLVFYTVMNLPVSII